MSFITKALASKELAGVDDYKQMFFDGTQRRGTPIENVIIGYLSNNCFRSVVLDACMIPADESAVCCAATITTTFKQGQALLKKWRETTKRMYPNRPDLLVPEEGGLPEPSSLTMGKLGRGGGVMTDGCDKARKQRRLTAATIKDEAIALGIPASQIKVFEQDCNDHARNVWINAVCKHLSKRLKEAVEDDLVDVPSNIRVHTDIVQLLIAVEKECARTANYQKGHGDDFHHGLRVYHPDEYFFPLARACGGARQDIAGYGSFPLIMNIPLIQPWMHDCLCINPDNLLQKSIFLALRSIEFIAILRVLSILHIAVTLPHRYLSGCADKLADDNFCVLDMNSVVDSIERAMEQIAADGELFLDEDFMMNIFADVVTSVAPLEKYLNYVFEDMTGVTNGGSRNAEDKVIVMDLLRAELFFPTRSYIRETHNFSCMLAEEIASVVLVELRDPRKVTAGVLESVKGRYCASNITEVDRQLCMGMKAHNAISESCHASATESLRSGVTVRLDHAGASGQTRMNGDFRRGHEAMVKGRRSKSEREAEHEGANLANASLQEGGFHALLPPLKESLVQSAREDVWKMRRRFDAALKIQRAERQRREEIKMRKKLDNAKEEFIVNIYLLEQFTSLRCWRTVEDAEAEFTRIPNKTQKLKAVKEQILIRFRGLGWDKAHHPWSRAGHTYSCDELFKHLIDTVIPLEGVETIPDEAPVDMPSPPDLPELGTTASVDLFHGSRYAEEVSNLKAVGYTEKGEREAMGVGDKWADQQSFNAPVIDETFEGFRIEMMFLYNDENGESLTNWYHGTVEKVLNKDTKAVKVKWDCECLGDGDKEETREKLLPSKWNPDKPRNGAWREYLTD